LNIHKHLVWLLLSSCISCDDNADVNTPDKIGIPERQFVFERIHLEERRGERVLWKGTGRRADGDLNEADVEDIELQCAGKGKRAGDFVIRSPRAHLFFDQGVATFQDVHITDEAGGILEAGEAQYEQEKGQIVASGPLTFAIHGLETAADRAVILIDEGTVDIAGPVRGVYIRPPSIKD